MALTFKTLDQEEATVTPYSNVGVILFGADGSWHAHRAGTGFERSGHGAPQGLEPGLWVADMDFDSVRALAKGAGGIMRADSWFKLPISQIRTAFGLSGKSSAQAIGIVSAIADRTYRLAQDALRANMDLLDYSSERDLNAVLEKAASLATGIAKINGQAMLRSGSDEKRVLDHFYKTYQAGMYIGGRKEPGDGHINLSFHFPRVSYAKKITRGQVPASCAVWEQAGRESDVSSKDFFREASRIGRPAIFMAICQPGASSHVPEHVQAFANGFSSSMSDTYRSRFLDEEIKVLDAYYDLSIESVIVGGSWKSCSTGALIDGLEEICGGEEAAAASWSAGLAAENILASALRSAGKEGPGKNAEAIWIAARDRAAMMPAIDGLSDVGAELVSANCGNITMRCPLDPELLMLVVGAAWEMGLVLPLESVSLLRHQGIQIPTEHSLFGGKTVDYLLSAVVHRRERNALWSLDGIMDLPISDRRKKFHKMISA